MERRLRLAERGAVISGKMAEELIEKHGRPSAEELRQPDWFRTHVSVQNFADGMPKVRGLDPPASI